MSFDDVKDKFDLPLAAYNVSGEYAMLKSAVKNGIIKQKERFMNRLCQLSERERTIIITYFAKDLAKMIHQTK